MVSDIQNRFKSAFVTGATGFVGRALVDDLLRHNFDVTALVRNESKANLPDEVTIAQGELGDLSHFDEIVGGCDVVLHVAALTPSVGVSSEEFSSTNVDGTARVIELCHQTAKRLVYVSTVNVVPFRSGASNDAYSKSKSEAEQLVVDAVGRGLDAVIVRPAYVFGNQPGQAGKLVDRLLAENLRVIPASERRFCPVFVGDLSTAIRLAIDRSERGSVHTVAGDCQTLGEFIDNICRYGNLKRPKIRIPYWISIIALQVAWTVRPVSRITPPLTVSSLRSSEYFDGALASANLGFEYTPISDLFG
jgi:dihydroflavonol-4-reductase